jgi:Co/Zn/Cd efflux system component
VTGETGLRRALLAVMALNLGYFGVEFAAALTIGSVALFADSVDFLEDASINLLILLALGWAVRARARLAMALAGLMLVPAGAFLWTLWGKFRAPEVPEAVALTLVGAGALAVNLTAALILARHRRHSGSLTRAAFLSARNDAAANVAIVGAGAATAVWPSVWPDVVVGLGIAAMNLDAAGDVWRAARREMREAADGEPSA